MEILMEPNYWGGNFCLAEVGGGVKLLKVPHTLDPCVNTFLKWICLEHIVYVSSFGLQAFLFKGERDSASHSQETQSVWSVL